MNVIEYIRSRVLKFLGLERLAENPYDARLTFIANNEDINKQDMDEARVWYIGDSNELLNYYTHSNVGANLDEPVYNRNRVNYFWGISTREANIKRVHSGLPKAIIDTLCNVVGFPMISATYDGKELDLSEMLKESQIQKKTMQEQLPLTMAIGWGAWKLEIGDKRISEYPTAQFYEAKNVEFIAKQDKIIGVIFKDYYEYNGKTYLLFDTRRINENGNSSVEYELFRLKNGDDLEPCELSEIPELANLESVELPNFKRLLAVPCRFYHNPNNPNYGRSIYYGRYDLFDDLDQSLSQRSQTSRVSTPVEYFPLDMLERNKRGDVVLPSVYNRQYVKKQGIPDGNGRTDSTIQTTQPQLNFEQYSEEQKSIVSMILNGVLSPATLGIDLSRKDNAMAQREKEKITIETRNGIIKEETSILRELITLLILLSGYMRTGNISLDIAKKVEISVKYSEFANPSFESLSATLLPLWQAGAISDKMYVEKLYGDSLSKQEKEEEIQALRENKLRDDMTLGAFEDDGQKMGEDLGEEEGDHEEIKDGKRQLLEGNLQRAKR